MFRFELSPWAPNEHQGLTSSPRTSVLPTFDFQSAIAKPCRKLRQPLIVSARNACVKRESRNFRGSRPASSLARRHSHTHPDGLVRRVLPGSRRALILPTDRRRNNPYFRGLPRVSLTFSSISRRDHPSLEQRSDLLAKGARQKTPHRRRGSFSTATHNNGRPFIGRPQWAV